MKKLPRLLASAIACATLALSACSPSPLKLSDSEATLTPTQASTQYSAGLASYYSQKVDWTKCGEFECATVKVPLDYANPQGESISLALKKREADGIKKGTLFINPGGPGGSGVDLVNSVSRMFSSDLLRSYDVVGFDPRGVSRSTAVDCLTDSETDAMRASNEGASLAKGISEKCSKKTNPVALLDHIDTPSAAKDLDILRQLSGDSKLNYLGYSYGTYLGATYADLFPSNVGRMVLDGAVDPTLSAHQVSLGQAKGFENSLRGYVAYCLKRSSCPLTGSVDDGVKQVRTFLEGLRKSPLKTSDPERPLTYSLAVSAVIGPLYADSIWDTLTMALSQGMKKHDGSMLLRIADLLASRDDKGHYTDNSAVAIIAINCLDYPVQGDKTTWANQAKELTQASPTFGASMAGSDEMCQLWGHKATHERTALTAKGSAPILVVGTTGDPATPYEWAQSLNKQLSNSRLLTWKGWGHTAYGRADNCITKAVDNYLLSGTLPADNKTCGNTDTTVK